MRYQSRIDRDFERAHQRLQDLRSRRGAEAHYAKSNVCETPAAEPGYLTMDEALIEAGIKEPELPANWAQMNRSQKRQWEAKQRKRMR